MKLDPLSGLLGARGSRTWPRWIYVAAPLLVAVLVAGIWWAAIQKPSGEEPATPAADRAGVVEAQPTPTALTAGSGAQLGVPEPTPTPAVDTAASPTPESIATPTATPQPAPSVFVVGDKVVVSGTEGDGLRMRADAGTSFARVKTISEGAVLEVLEGPKDGEGLTWYQVRDAAAVTGWVAGDYIKLQTP